MSGDNLIPKKDIGKWGFVDEYENWIIQPMFDEVFEFIYGLARVIYQGKIGYIDFRGAWVIEPRFENIGHFDVATWAMSDGKFGYININGDWIIKPQFDEVEDVDFFNGYAKVQKGGKWGWIDRNGIWYDEDPKEY